jgi:hypothetical protein
MKKTLTRWVVEFRMVWKPTYGLYISKSAAMYAIANVGEYQRATLLGKVRIPLPAPKAKKQKA